jgi:hypothetical protein
VADSLYFNVWFASFAPGEMLARLNCVLRQFPFSTARPGVTYVSLHPISWDEATVLERRFDPGIEPDQAAAVASDLVHEDYAYLFEASWDLWSPHPETGDWAVRPERVRLVAHGLDFDDQTYRENGHIQIDLGVDSLFLQEDMKLTPFNEARVRSNIQKLVEFTAKIEKNCGVTARLLWSESEENFAQKLISRLQKAQ